jgi:hypothetical protein
MSSRVALFIGLLLILPVSFGSPLISHLVSSGPLREFSRTGTPPLDDVLTQWSLSYVLALAIAGSIAAVLAALNPGRRRQIERGAARGLLYAACVLILPALVNWFLYDKPSFVFVLMWCTFGALIVIWPAYLALTVIVPTLIYVVFILRELRFSKAGADGDS